MPHLQSGALDSLLDPLRQQVKVIRSGLSAAPPFAAEGAVLIDKLREELPRALRRIEGRSVRRRLFWQGHDRDHDHTIFRLTILKMDFYAIMRKPIPRQDWWREIKPSVFQPIHWHPHRASNVGATAIESEAVGKRSRILFVIRLFSTIEKLDTTTNVSGIDQDREASVRILDISIHAIFGIAFRKTIRHDDGKP
ncbi:hypothetical protein BWQ93_12170 [Sphingopyxis sp. QXT-31]|nr:hypothetical protein BWQ93_12170 [Sphingopyxis sp. QXT-31]